MSNNKLIVTGSFLPSSRNTPLDARTRINSIANVESIEVPFIGMIFYVEDEQKFYKVLSLKSKKVGPVELVNSLIDKYEELINPDFITKDYIKGTIEDVDSLKTAIDLKSEKFTVGKGLDYSENKINLVINTSEDNALKVDESGLYVQVSEYSLDPVLNPESGFAAQYEFKKNGVVLNTINITEDQFLRDVTFHSYAEDGVNVEAPYLKFTWNVQNGSNVSYVPVGELVDVYEPGTAIDIKNNKISVKVASDSHGLSIENGSLKLNLASVSNDGAMSKEDKTVIDSLSHVYTKKNYEVVSSPKGTVVDYREKEVRIMCPVGTEFTKQQVGVGGNENMHYITFRAYAPENAVGFKEDTAKVIGDSTMYDFTGNGGNIDEFGRKYSRIWLAVASYDATSNSWTYFGAKSTAQKYIGWDYTVEWYDAEGVVIYTDTIRINLSNESCHLLTAPSYMAEYAKTSTIKVKTVDLTASNGISLLLDSEGKLSVNTDIETLASAVIAKHEIAPDTAETVVIVSEIGQYKVGTSIQSILEDLNSKITNSVHDIENGNGITVDSTNKNKPKISVNVNPESALIVGNAGLDIIWTEIS